MPLRIRSRSQLPRKRPLSLPRQKPAPQPRKPKLSKRKILLGIDEVGRGPWAGPLVIGAVILGRKRPAWDQLTDSKQLTRHQREELNQIILDKASATALGWLSSRKVDQYGLGQSLRYAARLALTNLLQHNYPETFAKLTNLTDLPPDAQLPFDEIVIDGTINFLADTPLSPYVTILPKADFLVKEVSAASIIAKVARDRYMVELTQQYPGYGFEQHVGYGTLQHQQALQQLGPCPEHRRSFRPIQRLLSASEAPAVSADVPAHATPASMITTAKATTSKTSTSSARKARTATNGLSSPQSFAGSTTSLGQCAEYLVINYLQERGHTLLAHNYKTKTYEIDIVTRDQQTICFTEVKYRKNPNHGSPLLQITPQKQHRMHYAATAFLAAHPEFRALQPLLAVAAVSGPDFQIEDWFTLS